MFLYQHFSASQIMINPNRCLLAYSSSAASVSKCSQCQAFTNIPPLTQAKSIRDNVTSILQREFEAAKEYVPSTKDWLSSYWSGFMSPHQKARIRNTGA